MVHGLPTVAALDLPGASGRSRRSGIARTPEFVVGTGSGREVPKVPRRPVRIRRDMVTIGRIGPVIQVGPNGGRDLGSQVVADGSLAHSVKQLPPPLDPFSGPAPGNRERHHLDSVDPRDRPEPVRQRGDGGAATDGLSFAALAAGSACDRGRIHWPSCRQTTPARPGRPAVQGGGPTRRCHSSNEGSGSFETTSAKACRPAPSSSR